jgi:hypothetical protein
MADVDADTNRISDIDYADITATPPAIPPVRRAQWWSCREARLIDLRGGPTLTPEIAASIEAEQVRQRRR